MVHEVPTRCPPGARSPVWRRAGEPRSSDGIPRTIRSEYSSLGGPWYEATHEGDSALGCEVSRMIRALVAGGTGFVGKKLTNALVARGWLVTVLTRSVGSSQRRLHPKVRLAGWNPTHSGHAAGSSAWEEEVEGIDVVVNLAGEGVFDYPWTRERIGELRASRIDVTLKLSQAIARAKKKPKLFVSTSAVGIYGMHKDDKVFDESGAFGKDVLADICKAWEKACGPAREAGVRVVHPRLGIVLGADGGALARMLPAFKWHVGGPLGDGKQWVSWVHWRDVVDTVTFAYEKTELEGPMNVTSPNPVTMNDFAHGIGLVLNRGARFRVPPFAVKVMLGRGAADALLTGQRAIPKKLQVAGYDFAYPDLVPALEELIGPK